MSFKTGSLFNVVSPCINMHLSNFYFLPIVVDLPGVLLCVGLTFRLLATHVEISTYFFCFED